MTAMAALCSSQNTSNAYTGLCAQHVSGKAIHMLLHFPIISHPSSQIPIVLPIDTLLLMLAAEPEVCKIKSALQLSLSKNGIAYY